MAQRYIDRGGEQAYAPPFLQEDTRLKAFVLRANPEAMQDLLDRTLNNRPGMPVSYRAIGRHLLLAHAPIGSTRSTEPPDSDKGYTPETDVAFWMLTGAGREVGGTWVLDRLAWFLPYVWVDVPTTMATGREVYGYPKEMCWLRKQSPTDPELLFGVDALVLPTRGEQTRLVRRPVIEVRGSGGEEEEMPDEEQRWSGPLSAIKDIFSGLVDEEDEEEEDEESLIVPGWRLLAQLAESLSQAEVPMVFLKQIRDVVDPRQACYSAVIESTARVVNVPMGWPLSRSYEVLIRSYSSHPIAADLGLGATGEQGEVAIRPSLAFELRFDFEVGLGEVIWERGPDRS